MRGFLTLIVGIFLLFNNGASFAIEQASEEEKLYRYFGAACDLRENGKHEEAIKILRYILGKNPDDDYVREYLNCTEEEILKQKEGWEIDNKKEVVSLKKDKIKTLTKEGSDYYKSGEFDKALLRFSDVLSLDSDNLTAVHYMKKLRGHYQKELEIETLVEGETTTPPVTGPMDEVEMQYLALNKKADRLLEQAELGYRIEEIIAAEKAEQKRSRQLTLGPGDIVQISVLDHPELSGRVTVQLKGEIILPLVNDLVMAKDLTIDELAKRVIETMKRYVQEPRVNVSAIERRSQRYYIVDEVGCTPYPITRRGFTLRDALFTADWGDNRALGRVIVMKPSGRYPIIKKVDAYDLVYRGKLKNNIRIEDGDVIYVPLTVAAKVTKTVQDFLGPFRAIRQARDNYLNLKWNEKDWRDTFRVPDIYDRQAEDGKEVRLENISLRDYIVTR